MLDISRNEALLLPLRQALYKHDSKALAKRLGLSRSTIEAFRSGRTVWPRPTTLWLLCHACNFELQLVYTGDQK